MCPLSGYCIPLIGTQERRTGTEEEQYFEAVERAQSCTIPLSTVLPQLVAQMKSDLVAALAAGAEEWAKLAITAIEESRYIRDLQGFSFKTASALISRLKERIRYHLRGSVLKEAHLLIVDAVLLLMLLPVPGHAFLWAEKELCRLFQRFRRDAKPKYPGLAASRIEADLIGLDLNMLVMTTGGAYS